jgi:MFS family permease
MEDQIKKMRKVSIVTLLSGAVEWYCFLLFGLATGIEFNATGIFSNPNWSEFTKSSVGWIIFAVGYIARPFGAMFFGSMGDRLGRKKAVIASLLTMGISTFLIGCLPEFHQIGVWSIVLLQLLRVIQCFGMGGSWGGGILMAFENADPKKKGFYAAIPQAGLPVGLALAGVVLLIPYSISKNAFDAFGWRVSFWFAVLLAFLVLYIKVHMMETKDFQELQKKVEAQEKEAKKQAMPLKIMFTKYWKTLLLGCGTRWIDGTWYNVIAVWTLGYLTLSVAKGGHVGMSQSNSLIINIIFSVCIIPMIFLAGKLSDKFGKARIFMIGALSCGIFAVPGLLLFQHFASNFWVITIIIVIGWSGLYSLVWGSIASLWSQLFETEVRYSGISFVYHAPSVIVAGIVPFVANWLQSLAHGGLIGIGIFCLIIGIISTLCGYELKKRHAKQMALEGKSGIENK